MKINSLNVLQDRPMIIRNEDVKALTVEIPKGHKHLRTTIKFDNGKVQ